MNITQRAAMIATTGPPPRHRAEDLNATRILLPTTALAASLARPSQPAEEPSFLPNRAGSVKFAAIGDNGTGDQPQYDVTQWGEIAWRVH